MSGARCVVAAVLLASSARAAEMGGAPPETHDRAFWRGIVQSRYQVPAGESADALVLELSDTLGSPDPEMRDDLAYSIAAAWIYRDRRVSEKTRRRLLETWTGNLRAGLGGTATDEVFLRSFSALEAVATKVGAAGTVFTHGENERLAAAAFTTFLAALAEPGAHLWDKGPLVDPARYAATQNAKDLLRSLYVKLALRPPPGPEASRSQVLKTLEKLGP